MDVDDTELVLFDEQGVRIRCPRPTNWTRHAALVAEIAAFPLSIFFPGSA